MIIFDISIETPKETHVAGLEFPDEVFKPEYVNLEDPVTKQFTDVVKQAVSLVVVGFVLVFVFLIIFQFHHHHHHHHHHHQFLSA